MKTACYHARKGWLTYPGHHAPRYGQRVTVLVEAPRGASPRNALVLFADGERAVTNIGCLKWHCAKEDHGTHL